MRAVGQPWACRGLYFDGQQRAARLDHEIHLFTNARAPVTQLRTLDARATLAKYGEVPLPPYIRRAPDAADRERYQTVYAAHDGSVAAPTAGLHFTPELLADIHTRQIRVASLDLHVGPGTFKPVETEDLAQHPMHAEAFDITPGAEGGVCRRSIAGGDSLAIMILNRGSNVSKSNPSTRFMTFTAGTRRYVLRGFRNSH